MLLTSFCFVVAVGLTPSAQSRDFAFPASYHVKVQYEFRILFTFGWKYWVPYMVCESITLYIFAQDHMLTRYSDAL